MTFLLREVLPGDLDGLHEIARYLDTVNLPDDRAVLEDIVERSQRSFAGQLKPAEREFVFALLDVGEGGAGGGRLVGTSMIHAQHGTRRAPHIYFDVIPEERYSETIDKHVAHTLLRIGFNYSGPTEIGGLVLHPDYRGHELGLGRWLSYVRFLYIALHRAGFRDQVISELLPPLEPDGTSLLWEALGRRFTGMSYQEADRLSKSNKEFIRALFPVEPLYTCLLPREVQALIGVVGPETRGVEKMLRRIGFQYANRIDPFDGGPHFVARTDDITLVRATVRARVAAAELDGSGGAEPALGLVCVESTARPVFAATGCRFRLSGGEVALPAAARRVLGVAPGAEIGLLPFP